MDQKTALDLLKMGKNVFLTGPAGSGKTYLINEYFSYLRKYRILAAKTASTGIAATHIDGMTIHSWSRIGIKSDMSGIDIKKLKKDVKIRNRFLKTKVLLIDEISMLHAYQLDMVNQICQAMKESLAPFGGMQVILIGDFFQLPPVTQYNQKGETRYAFESDAWQEASFNVCYLDKIYRQQNDVLIKVLGDIRSGTVSGETEKLLATRRVQKTNEKVTKLYTHNCDVDVINSFELFELKGESSFFSMRSKGDNYIVENVLKKSCLAPQELELKKGAFVMFVKNNFDKGYVNGTTGTVRDFEADTGFPIVETEDDRIFVAAPAEWTIEEAGRVIASVTQIPLRLAWAITVHKSQGMTLDRAEIDLGKSFEYGMGYVALSRVSTLAGIFLLDYNNMSLQVNPRIIKIDEAFSNFSSEIERSVIKLLRAEANKIKKDWIMSATEKDSFFY